MAHTAASHTPSSSRYGRLLYQQPQQVAAWQPCKSSTSSSSSSRAMLRGHCTCQCISSSSPRSISAGVHTSNYHSMSSMSHATGHITPRGSSAAAGVGVPSRPQRTTCNSSDNRIREGSGNSSSSSRDEHSGSSSAGGGAEGGSSGGGDAAGGGGSSEPAGNPRFPAWYSVWMWATAAIYLVWRWRWRRDRRLAAEQFAREQQLEQQAQQDWHSFARQYGVQGPNDQGG